MSCPTAVRRITRATVAGALLSAALLAAAEEKAGAAKDLALFNFEAETSLRDWEAIQLPDVLRQSGRRKLEDQPAPNIKIVPLPKKPKQAEGPAGKCLEITFAGGDWPTVTTTKIPVGDKWLPFQALKADLIVDRPCTAYFCIRGSKSLAPSNPRLMFMECTLKLLPGWNEVVLAIGREQLRKKGDPTAFIIGMYRPEKGQSLRVANVRLSAILPPPIPKDGDFRFTPYWPNGGYSVPIAREYERTGALPRFKVLGTDLEVGGARDLGARLKDKWTKPEAKTIEQVEAEFKAEFEKIKQTHPRAILAVLRDGEKGFDPANPDKVYSGWKGLHLSCHGPSGPLGERDHDPNDIVTEVFMRHRSAFLKVDLSSIPKDAAILAARFAVTHSYSKATDKPNLWVAEPCNRDWDETAVNALSYAKGKLWKNSSGVYYGADPDFWPLFIAHGPAGSGAVSAWDFTEALRFWRDGKHSNHGFMLHGDAGAYFLMYTHRAKEMRQRPLLLVIYEPKS
jgi:hypothetical protein